MKKVKKIYVIACMHGNELFGLKVLSNLAESGNDRVVTSIGNIGAVSKNVRFIESDLNRSFGTMVAQTRESRLAKQIVADIKREQPDLIIDLHSSTVDVGKVGIVAKDTPFLRSVAKHLLMDKLAVMLPELSSLSLLGRFPQKAIALEFGKHLRSDRLAGEISQKILELLDGVSDENRVLETYSVKRIVSKAEVSGLEFSNYVFNKKLDGYPFLMGETNYSDYAGFLADRVDSL